jgi:pyruvate formate lyase activating enzyme
LKGLSDLQIIKGDGVVKCILCPKTCILKEGQSGFCSARRNVSGSIVNLGYGQITSIAMDPIEKKPLFHFKPGKQILSIGGFGCNLSCLFCQNHRISKGSPNSYYLSPEDLVGKIIEDPKNTGIAFTYNEPLINYEYIMDVSRLLKSMNPNKSVVLVTNGYINEKPLEVLLDYVDAVNLDIKSIENSFYKKICSATVDQVLDNVKLINKKVHLEITNLIIGGFNDGARDIETLVDFISQIDKSIPIHFSRSFPAYRMPDIYTSQEAVLSAMTIAEKYMDYVYGGNMERVDNNTYCKVCGNKLIERSYYGVSINNKIEKSCCRNNNIVY